MVICLTLLLKRAEIMRSETGCQFSSASYVLLEIIRPTSEALFAPSPQAYLSKQRWWLQLGFGKHRCLPIGFRLLQVYLSHIGSIDREFWYVCAPSSSNVLTFQNPVIVRIRNPFSTIVKGLYLLSETVLIFRLQCSFGRLHRLQV